MTIKFVRKDYPTIQDGLVIRYKVGRDDEISASRNCVAIYMNRAGLKNPEDFLEIKKYLDRAYLQFLELSVHGKDIPEETLDERDRIESAR